MNEIILKMITAALKLVYLTSIIIIITGCTTVETYVISNEEQEATVTGIVEKNLTDLTGLPAYSDDMESGQTFLLTVIPGMPMSDTELLFTSLSGMDLLGDPEAIDSAYRFSNMVNDVLISGRNFQASGIQFDNLYTCLLQHLPSGIVSEDDLQFEGITKITSATYNDDFLMTITVPADGGESTWSSYEKKQNRYGVLINSSGRSSINRPVFTSYHFSASLKQLNIFRPWLNENYLSINEGKKVIHEQCAEGVDQPIAQITGLLLAKNLEMYRPEISIETLESSGSQENPEMYEAANPELRLYSEGPIIIGFICKTL